MTRPHGASDSRVTVTGPYCCHSVAVPVLTCRNRSDRGSDRPGSAVTLSLGRRAGAAAADRGAIRAPPVQALRCHCVTPLTLTCENRCDNPSDTHAALSLPPGGTP